MNDLHAQLAELLASMTDVDGIIGVAVAPGTGLPIQTTWSPQSSGDEPAFLAYSFTKTFIAALALLLNEEGRLRLDDRLARWFPHIPGAERITLRNLLNHTAGIPDYGGLRQYHDELRATPEQPWAFERFAAETFDKGLQYEPGTGWAYSNPGYMLLKRIVEESGSASFANLVAGRIAGPLELRRTFVAESLADLAALAPATSQALAADKSARDVRRHYHPGWVSHGVVAAPPSDIVRFTDALFGGRLVSPQSLAEMTTLVPVPVPAAPAGAPPPRWVQPSYGLGLMGDPAARWGVVWGHNGGGPGYSTSAWNAPGLGGVSVCAMAAIEAVTRVEDVVFAVFDLLAGARLSQH